MSRNTPRNGPPTRRPLGVPAAPAGTGPLVLAAAGVAAAAFWHGVSAYGASAGPPHRVRIGPAALHLHEASARPPQGEEPVSILLPLRHALEPALTAVKAALGQRRTGPLDVVVLDEGCPFETRTGLRREFGDDPRLRILYAAPLPRGWSRPAHRGHQLAVAARGRVLIFAEPGAPLGPDAAASAIALLRGEQLELAVLDAGRQTVGQSARLSGAGVDSYSGRFAVAVDAGTYWRTGGYRAAAADPDPLALLRTVRRATGRTGIADGRQVIPRAPVIEPLPAAEYNGAPEVGGGQPSRPSLSDTARRLLSVLVGPRS